MKNNLNVKYEYELEDLGTGDVTYVKPSEMAEGDVIQGVYTSMREGEYEGKATYTYYIEQADGTTLGLNGCGHLDYWFQSGRRGQPIPFGHFVVVTYNGMKKYKGAKKPAHNFSVKASKAPVVSDLSGASESKNTSSKKIDKKLQKEISD